MPSPQIIVVGSIITDLISYTDVFPKPGESKRGNLFKFNCGGKGANQAVSAAKLGSNVKMIACIGDDIFGEENVKKIKESGVNVDGVLICKENRTGVASIMIDKYGENITVVNLGANLLMNVDKIRQIEDEIKKSSLVILQNGISHEGILECMRIAQRNNVQVLYNGAPGIRDLDQEYLQLTDYFVVNENEAECLSPVPLTSDNDFIMCAMKLIKIVRKAVIITRGGKSTIVAIKDGSIECCQIMADKVVAIDTNGAGDCFCGAFAHAIITNKFTIKDSVFFASKAAALSVQKTGTHTSYPTIDEVNQILQSN
uniref:Ribokinase n=1 Tax=Strongyloides venezuelensis TaxID=75913 RepID=A0A0K0FA32_STRVS